MSNNIILTTDSYKISHYRQYPSNTQYIYSYLESRGGKWQNVLFFGPQYCIKKFLEGRVVTKDKIDEGEEISALHFGNPNLFNRAGWEYILNKHDGRLPLRIKAVPEGTVVPGHNVLMTIENTDPNCYWLTNYVETLMVQNCWYATTVATQSREMKHLILKYLNRTGDPSLIDFKLHDFGERGVSSLESAGIGGAAHLINFKGTDTLEGVLLARKYYNEPMAGFSIPAAEHSTITSWGRAHEVDALNNMLEQYPTGLVAVVSDSFDIFEACANIWGGELRDKVLNRKGTVVIRPDSGDPITVLVAGQPNVFSILGEKFGYTINSKGYKVLNPHVRVIQGDGVDFESLDNILFAMQQAGWSADNIAFGSGGALLQKVNRDTLKFAFKCAAIVKGGQEYPVYKSPITDKGKQSKSGRMKLVRVEGSHGYTFATVPASDPREDQLVEIYRNGEMLQTWTFEEIRNRARIVYV